MLKWAVDQANAGGEAGNDYAVIRYADILLHKAEASMRQGDDATALSIVNDIRARAGATALTSISAWMISLLSVDLSWLGKLFVVWI